MIALVCFFLSSLSHATDVSPVLLNSKVILPKARSYHFSDAALVKADLSNSSKPYFVGLKEGLLKVKYNQKDLNFLILNKKKYQFFKTTNTAVQGSVLKWGFSAQALTLSGKTMSKAFSKFLVDKCMRSEARVLLKINPKPKNTLHPCLGYIEDHQSAWVSLMLVSKAKLKDFGYGLGVPESLPWNINENQQLELENVFGEIQAGSNKNTSQGEFYFEGSVAKDQPLTFSSGLEVGVQPRTVFGNATITWKNITNTVTLNLLELNDRQGRFEIDLTKKNRTGEENVFKTESFKKTHLATLNTWIKALTFLENTDDKNKTSPLGISLFGKNSKSKSMQDKEVWIKISTKRSP